MAPVTSSGHGCCGGPDPTAVTQLCPHDGMRLRVAAHAARRRYPGPVGDLVARELLEWEAFGFRFGAHRRVADLATAVLADGGGDEPDEVDAA